jgi:hypothetical protein
MDRAVRIPYLLVAVIVGIAVAAGLAVADHGVSKATFMPPHTSQGAARDAALVLRSVVLPEGAQRLSRQLRGDGGVLGSSGPHEAYADLVDRHTWWRVPGPWRSVLAFVNAHPPPGSRDFTSGSGSTYGRETSAFVVFGWPMTAGSRTRQLTVSVAATSRDATYLRLDADVVWLLRRSASEQIPGGVHAIDITQGLPGHAPSQSLTVSDAAKVKAIIAVSNSLPTIQPGEFDGCNAAVPVGFARPKITFTFRTSPRGSVLAVATEPANATGTGTCEPMMLSINGLPRKPLLEGPKVVAEAQRLLKEGIVKDLRH